MPSLLPPNPTAHFPQPQLPGLSVGHQGCQSATSVILLLCLSLSASVSFSPPTLSIPSVSPEGHGAHELSASCSAAVSGVPENAFSFATYLPRRGLEFLNTARICLAHKWLSMDGVHSGAAGLWVWGAGLGAAATATIHRIGLPAPKGGHGKGPQHAHPK